MKIGERLRHIRGQFGLTQEKVANIFGIGADTLSRYENGNRTPDNAFLEAFGKHFNISGDWLLYEELPISKKEFKDQDIKGMFLEMASLLERQDKPNPVPTDITEVSKENLENTPENFILMIEYMLKYPEVCRNMFQFFYLFQKPLADRHIIANQDKE